MSVTIERLGHHGDGIAAGPIFVPLTLPGEVVEGDIADGRIASPKIIAPSADRVRPPCSHFKSCGGCSLQHASDSFVAGWKAGVVETALAAHGLTAPIRGVKTSPPGSRRRASFSGRRTKKGALVGFHARASGTVIEVPNCQILHPGILSQIPACQRLTIIGASRKGEISMSVTVADKGTEIAVTGGKPLDMQLRQELSALIAQFVLARLTWDDETVAQEFPPVHLIDGIAVSPPPGSFLQATKEGETGLIRSMTEAVGPAKTIADLFSGCGTFALPLARDAEVHAVESEAEMLTALDVGWRKSTGLKKVTTETRDLFRMPLLPIDLRKFDAVVLDPPRAGAETQTTAIAESVVPRVGFVSCNPVTFARDAKILVDAGFTLDWIDVIDQFRWSPHVEIAAQFTRPKKQAKPLTHL